MIMDNKSTLKEIEERFDRDVARFANLKTGQQTTLDAKFNMDIITDGILQVYPEIHDVLDIGCGAGNYPVNLLMKANSNANVTLIDLSKPMLSKARERIEKLTSGEIREIKGDFRSANLKECSFDVIIATAVLHHLRDDADWESAFSNCYKWLKPGGSIWIFDLVTHNQARMQELIYTVKYGEYLTGLKDEAYRDHVFAYIEKEDSPRSVDFQLDLLRKVGFSSVDILHKHLCFASFVAFK